MKCRAFDCSQFIDGGHEEGADIGEDVMVEEGEYNGNMENDGSGYESGHNGEFEQDGGSGQPGEDEGVNYGDMEEDGSDEEGVDYGSMEDGSDEEGVDYGDMEEDGSDDENQHIQVDSADDIVALDLSGLGPLFVRRIEFGSQDIAYEFYKSYGRANGFTVRKGKLLYCKSGEVVQLTFLCHREGYRIKGITEANRKHREKPYTRCGCQAMFRVHINSFTNRWSATVFNNQHNHELASQEHCGLLSSHCVMTDSDIMQMNNMRI
ncbi:putative transcription factor FAR family [Medicago truncatula]|uniref:Putative transcription factor FAR family n=1 Tax=Medicago truncatula TaxID=3880 RepID=A0A396JNK0_MEDTR|nr:putative transcription factor FAR family [Medicago truncatula]